MVKWGASVGADNFNISPKRSFDQERYIGRQVKTQKDSLLWSHISSITWWILKPLPGVSWTGLFELFLQPHITRVVIMLVLPFSLFYSAPSMCAPCSKICIALPFDLFYKSLHFRLCWICTFSSQPQSQPVFQGGLESLKFSGKRDTYHTQRILMEIVRCKEFLWV